jgi:hypothetical protein
MTATRPLTAPHSNAGIDRRIVLIGVGLVVVIGAAFVAALLIGDRSATYPADSPEAAYVAFLDAWEADDVATAYAALSPRIRAARTYDEYAIYRGMYRDPDERRAVYIEGVERDGERATLRSTIEHVYGTGLTASRWSETDVAVHMVQVDGTWYVDQLLAGTQEVWD